MKQCCVPDCYVGNKLHRVPCSNGTGVKWKRWLEMCPFFLKYSLKQLQEMRICRKHFLPEHIDFEKGRLGYDAIPLLHLPPPKHTTEHMLEITPIQPNEQVNFKVISPTPKQPRQTENLFKCPTTKSFVQKRKEKHLFCLKADDMHGFPIDHSMYCLPSQPNKKIAPWTQCVTGHSASTELLSSDHTALCVQSGKDVHNQLTAMPLHLQRKLETKPAAENIETICDTQLKGEGTTAASSGIVSKTSQTIAKSQILFTRLTEPLPDNLSAEMQYPQKQYLKKEANLFVDPQWDTVDNDVDTQDNDDNIQDNNDNTQDNVCVPSANVFKPFQSKPVQAWKDRGPLEALLAEWEESVEEATLQSFPDKMKDNTPAIQLNLTPDSVSQVKPCPMITLHPLTPKIKPKRFRYNKEKSSKKEQILYKELNKLRTKLGLATRQNKLLKSKLKLIRKATKPYLINYPRLSPTTKALIDSQLRLVGIKPNGARYSEEEKLFAVKLYQISPHCYEFLQQYFKLPRRTTMKVIMKNI